MRCPRAADGVAIETESNHGRHLDYRTVTGVNGPLVILDNVKVCIICISLLLLSLVTREGDMGLFYSLASLGARGDDASRRRRRFDTLRETHTLVVSDIDL